MFLNSSFFLYIQHKCMSLFTCGEAHDIEDTVQLVMMVWVTGLNVLLPTVENRLRGQELSKDTADRPYICTEGKVEKTLTYPVHNSS